MSETPSPTSEITSNPENFSGSDAPSDSSGLTITYHRLNGNNFLEWSQSVKIFLLGRERWDYVTGEIKKPAVTDAGFAKWMRDNGQVMTWLLNSMTPSISRNFLLYTTAAEIWSAVRETYSSTDNIAELYHQLDLYAHYDWVDPRDAALYQQIVTQRRLFQFLQGLNKDLDEIRGRVLAISPLPSLREAFSMVKKEESRRCVMLSDEPYSTSERSALLTHQSSPSSKWGDLGVIIAKSPATLRRSVGSFMVSLRTGSPSTLEIINQALSLPPLSLVLLKNKLLNFKNYLESFKGLVRLTPNWILDSGATDHMTGNKALFHNFFHTFGKAVKTADGTLCKIEGHGTVILNEQIALKNVLFVPNLACNLISALNSKKMIGKASLHNGLYILPTSPKIEISKSFTALGKVDTHFPHFKPISSILPLKIFGCTVFIQNIAPNKSKLDPKSLKCVLVGYSSLKKGYKCYHPPSKRFFTTMDITFYEQDSYFTQAEIQREIWSDFQPQQVSPPNLHSQPSELPSCSPLPADLSPVNAPIDSPVVPVTNSPTPTLNILPENTPTPIDSLQKTPPPKQLRVYTRKRKHIPETVLQSDSCRKLDLGPAAEMEEEISKSTTLDDFPIAIRKGVRQCTKHPIEKFTGYNSLMPSFQVFTATLDKEQVPTSIAEALKDPKWRRAVEEEICALEKNPTWTITDLPQGKKAVGCKWIFVVKYNSNGSIQRYKARLVARGFTQTYGIDFTETFAPVAKLNTIRVLLSLAVNCDWKLHQLDVKNAFLNGKLEEEVYMQLPPGSKSIEGSNKSLADHTLFIKVTSTNKKAILIVYVDDIILTGNDEEEISNLKKLLNREFETKDLGKLRYFLGMEGARSKEGLVINQRKYVFDLLKETGFLGYKPADTPMEANLRFNKEDGSLVDREKFQRLVGKLIYLSLTRPDIAFPVNLISQHMTNPTEEHMAAANRILKYLKKTPGHGLMFKKTQDRTVKIFIDSSWAGDLTERRSTSGYCTFVWVNLTTWRSKKQSIVSRSSAEAEFRALALGICEGIWLLKLLKELGTNQEDHFEVLCDDQSAIQIAKNPVQHDRTKHVEIDRHFIADQVNKKTATLSYIPSEGQIADILTKALPKPVFNKFLFKLGLYNVYSPA
ncbi:hypothetical protein CXB51_001585 [Gossypium anomalum]|uniref:Reverse transcriptase Ty1/copia-type domain-containing protein n=1 Tax=Gossypium anomalum TaxID=47600 RepID=A0A8J5ZK57_9ROSI|nr:hypothetical protein CXB51_001585 [Gossypium anomalum]